MPPAHPALPPPERLSHGLPSSSPSPNYLPRPPPNPDFGASAFRISHFPFGSKCRPFSRLFKSSQSANNCTGVGMILCAQANKIKMPIYIVRLLLVFSLASSSFFCTAVAAPSITSVSPDPVTGSNNKQTFTVYGSGFVSGAQVKLAWPPVGVAPAGNATLVTTYITSSQLQVNATFGTDACTWTAQAINPGSVTSSTYGFSVQAPAPVITSLSPSSASSGGGAFNLTVNGSTFAQNSVVRWNGISLTTTATVNAGGLVTALTAQVPAANIAPAGSATVTIYTPTPGGGTSSGAIFTVNSSGGGTVQLSGVPYIHQLYDTADGFTAGNDCCNAVAALMAIQYYRKIARKSNHLHAQRLAYF